MHSWVTLGYIRLPGYTVLYSPPSAVPVTKKVLIGPDSY